MRGTVKGLELRWFSVARRTTGLEQGLSLVTLHAEGPVRFHLGPEIRAVRP